MRDERGREGGGQGKSQASGPSSRHLEMTGEIIKECV